MSKGTDIAERWSGLMNSAANRSLAKHIDLALDEARREEREKPHHCRNCACLDD